MFAHLFLVCGFSSYHEAEKVFYSQNDQTAILPRMTIWVVIANYGSKFQNVKIFLFRREF